MALWRRRPRLLTSYGYQPPPEATVHGWRCASRDCAMPVRYWRRRCRRCGSPADPEFDQPWAHEALGAELTWLVTLATVAPGREAGLARDRLIGWRVKDAVLRGDGPAAAAARRVMRDHAELRRTADSRWSPGPMLGLAVSGALGLSDLDGAAGDLCFWLEMSGEDTAGGRCAFGNATSVMHAVVTFLAAPGGAAHPLADEIRRGCLRVAGGCLRAGR
jgi:hypothetical protein